MTATNLGIVTNLTLTQADAQAETFWLAAHDPQGERLTLLIAEGLARSLWANLTQILYPRAADLLTQRAETAKGGKPDSSEVSYHAQVIHVSDHAQVEVRGRSSFGEWDIRFSMDDAHELWATLENKFGNVT